MAANAMRTPSISLAIKSSKQRFEGLDRAGENRRCRNGIYLSEVTIFVEHGVCKNQTSTCALQPVATCNFLQLVTKVIAGKVIDKTNHHVGNLLARNQQALSRFIRRIVPCIEFNIGASHRELLVPSMFPTGK